eukprot:TRINITY_DN584_c0_g1_i13.p1 TRINITY_DN584_c0_g1~~TRINITY_DN584_c0_g1_i13.p1  ORF type:complete len:238 (-),score=44.99 TRINITY_DN584_c0_g1_i13:948-1661(-)
MNSLQKPIDNYKKEFFRIDEESRKELLRYNKLALQLSCLSENPELLDKFKALYSEISPKILSYIDQMESVIKSISVSSTRMMVKDKNSLMRLKQIHQDYIREYKQYKVLPLPLLGNHRNQTLFTHSHSFVQEQLRVERQHKDNDEQAEANQFFDNDCDGHYRVSFVVSIRSGNSISNEFRSQSQKMKSTNTKLQQLVTVVPDLDHIMKKMRCLRSRNSVIVGCVMAIMIFLMYVLWK